MTRQTLLMLCRACFAAALLCQPLSAFAQNAQPPENLDIYLLIGQSNMAGRAKVPDDAQGVIDRCWLLNDENQWVAAKNPLNLYSTIRKGAGMQKLNPGYGFVRKMLAEDPDLHIGLVVNARGGSKIDQWQRRSEYYMQAGQRTAAAMKHGTLRGILWHQGESDANKPETYLKKLGTLVQNFRKDFEIADLPFVAGQIRFDPHQPINDQIAKLPDALDHTAVASSKGLKTYDRWHFDTESQIELGERYAQQMLKLQGKAQPNAQDAAAQPDAAPGPAVLDHDELKGYVERFNAEDEELYANIPNKDAYAFLKNNIPLFDCPAPAFERTYYFRWWTYRKHIKKTDDGYVVTEFLPEVNWSGKHNTIVCPVGHQFYEGRWLHDPVYLDDYARFWMRGGGNVRAYSNWLVDSLYARHLVTPNQALLVDLLPDLVRHYEAWEKGWKGRRDYWIGRNDNGLYFSVADRDGMEVGIGGDGFRPTQNSYRYGDALAIAAIARMAGNNELAQRYQAKAKAIKRLVQDKLWDEQDKFFKVMKAGTGELADVREQIGYTPWYFNLPDEDAGYEAAWKQLMDPQGFYAPFGPTTAEQRDPRFTISYKGHECQWNGPSWPLATSVTLTALANVLNDYDQDAIDKQAYFDTLQIYTNSHTRTRDDGSTVPWIDENLNPHTGEWISRTRLKSWKDGTWDPGKGGKERGKDYNHSSYNDLIITGLVGLRPRPDNTLEVNPLLPEGTWDYFCLDNVKYKGRVVTILWDKTGERYGKGAGLSVFVNGERVARASKLGRVTAQLDAN